ncbi:UNKNOWN [Stylonychia lemnae]|uniref:Glucosyltransferase 24 catalytic domain-containing protein n=1 Tax=Stylonychia lemnae TaxID=5949 RepID=A0A078A678_STYLE|nr:UNKNOWN [Stylonychia lemnae]|eukprot:CDW77760.1 UNKNOWN [Stylonychia lemnae]
MLILDSNSRFILKLNSNPLILQNIQPLLSQFQTKNYILRYKFSQCLDPTYARKEYLTGMNINFRPINWGGKLNDRSDQYKWHLTRPQGLSQFAEQVSNPLKYTHNYSARPNEVQWKDINFSNQYQYVLINYKLLLITLENSEPWLLYKEFNEIDRRSRIISQYFDQQNLIKIWANIHDLKNPNLQNTFKINFEQNQEDFILLLQKGQRQEESTLSLAKITLFLDVGLHFKSQLYLIQSLTSLLQTRKHYQVRISLNDVTQSNPLAYSQIYNCIQKQNGQSDLTLKILLSFFNGNFRPFDFYCDLETENTNLQSNAENACQKYRICDLPLVMINDTIFDSSDLRNHLNIYNHDNNLNNFFNHLIISKTQEDNTVIPTSSEELVTDSFNLDLKNIQSIQEIKNQPRLRCREFSQLSNQNLSILVTLINHGQKIFDQNDIEMLEKIKSEQSQFDYVIIDKNVQNVEIVGFLQSGQDFYAFINGIYIPQHQFNYQYLNYLIEYENFKLDSILNQVQTLDSHQIGTLKLITEINFNRFLDNDIDSNKRSEIYMEFENLRQQKSLQLHSSPGLDPQTKELRILAKLNFLSRESVSFVTNLAQQNYAFSSLDIYPNFNLLREDFIRFLPYHNFRQFSGLDPKNNQLIHIQDFIMDRRFRYAYVELLPPHNYNFVIEKLSRMNSYFKEDQETPVIGYNLTLEIEMQFLYKLKEEEFLDIDFKLVQFQNMYKLREKNQVSAVVSQDFKMGTEYFTSIAGLTKVNRVSKMLDQFYYLRGSGPGRYYIQRENTSEIIIVDFNEFGNFQIKDLTFLNQKLVPLQNNNNTLMALNSLKNDKEYVSIYYQVAGSEYETLLLHQIYQIVAENMHQLNYKFYFVENTFISPDFKKHIKALQQNFNFEIEYFNFAWPYQIMRKPKAPQTNKVFYRILFLDQMIEGQTGKQAKVLYKDADQCQNPETDLSELFRENLGNHSYALAPYGYDFMTLQEQMELSEYLGIPHNKTDWQKARRMQYFYCGGLFIADIDRFVESGDLDKMRRYFNQIRVNKEVNYEVNDQQIMNDVKKQVPIKLISWKWVWTNILYKDYGNKMREAAKVIDFHGSVFSGKQSTKLDKAQSLCQNFDSNFQQLKQLIKQYEQQQLKREND